MLLYLLGHPCSFAFMRVHSRLIQWLQLSRRNCGLVRAGEKIEIN